MMDRDDAQLQRHASRQMAESLTIFYREMLRAGLPRWVAGIVTREHYRWLMSSNPMDVVAEMMEQIRQDDDE
jgi:hypothetical protein